MFRELTRKNKALSHDECVELLKTQPRGVLSVLGDDHYPYGMPMNHFYCEEDGCVYFHCGKGGHRLDAVKRHSKVSFCVYDEGVRAPGAWALQIRSVILFGTVEILDDPDLIVDVTTRLSRKFTDDEQYIQNEIRQFAHKTLLLRLTPQHICGKVVTEA